MGKYISEEANLRLGIAASADLYAPDPESDAFDMSEYERIAFVVHHGNGATGTATLGLLAASDASGRSTIAAMTMAIATLPRCALRRAGGRRSIA